MKVKQLPIFLPTDYMFENFKHLGSEKADIYAEVVRTIMGKAGNLPLVDAGMRESLECKKLRKRGKKAGTDQKVKED